MSTSLPHHLYSHSNQCFQILLDKIFKDMIAQKKESVSPVMPDDGVLSVREENALRYMSGYVAFHLLNKYRKATADPEQSRKWKFFVHVLEKMKLEEQLPCEDNVEDYSRAWSEHINRGGLCHTKPEVSSAMVID